MPPLTSSDDALTKNLRQITRFSPRFAQRDPGAAVTIAATLRKIRAVLPVLATDIGVVHKLDNRMKRTIGRLKKLRDIDALLALVDELGDSERVGRAAVANVRNAVRQSSAVADAGKLRRKTAADLTRLVERLAALAPAARDLSASEISQRRAAAFGARAPKQAEALRQALTEAGTVFLVDRLRPLRRAIHRMRDEVQPLADASIFGLVEARALTRAAELLDRIRDLRRLIKRVGDTQKALTPPDLHAWHQLDALIIALESRSRRLHARLLRERPTLLRLCLRLSVRPVATRARRKAS